MIVEWFLGLAQNIVDWFGTVVGTGEPPAFITSVVPFLQSIVTSSAGLGAWVPWAYLGLITGTILALWLTFVTVKAVRWLWGLTPFSGGS